MTPINPPSAGAVQDAVRILREDFHSREADAVSQMLTQYWSEEWTEAMQRRPDHIPAHLWAKWRLEDEIVALRGALAEAHQRIDALRSERNELKARQAAHTDSDHNIAQAFRILAREAARFEGDANRFRRERFERDKELRSEVAERERFRQLAIERGAELERIISG